MDNPNNNIVVAFDVDGTLIYEVDDSPRYDVIPIFNYFKSIGCRMVIWSGGGVPYAERWAQKLGLKAEVLEKWSLVPDLVFDDFPTGKDISKVAICVGNNMLNVKERNKEK